MATLLHSKMTPEPLTSAQHSHAVRSEVRWLLSEPVPPQTREENETLFRARLEKSLKESGGYGQLIEHCGDRLEPALKMLTHSIQELIMETLFHGKMLDSPKTALTTLEEETTNLIDNA